MKPIRKLMVLCGLSLFGLMPVQAENDFGNLRRYAQDNVRVKQLPLEQRRVVFLGNSITDAWINAHPDFFSQNGYIDRGISGQSSYQFVVRFRADVIELKPQVVVNAAVLITFPFF